MIDLLQARRGLRQNRGEYPMTNTEKEQYTGNVAGLIAGRHNECHDTLILANPAHGGTKIGGSIEVRLPKGKYDLTQLDLWAPVKIMAPQFQDGDEIMAADELLVLHNDEYRPAALTPPSKTEAEKSTAKRHKRKTAKIAKGQQAKPTECDWATDARWELGKLEGKTTRFTATIQAVHPIPPNTEPAGYCPPDPGIVVKDLRTLDGKLLAEHVWLFVQLGRYNMSKFRPGTEIKFKGTVIRYKKRPKKNKPAKWNWGIESIDKMRIKMNGEWKKPGMDPELERALNQPPDEIYLENDDTPPEKRVDIWVANLAIDLSTARPQEHAEIARAHLKRLGCPGIDQAADDDLWDACIRQAYADTDSHYRQLEEKYPFIEKAFGDCDRFFGKNGVFGRPPKEWLDSPDKRKTFTFLRRSMRYGYFPPPWGTKQLCEALPGLDEMLNRLW